MLGQEGMWVRGDGLSLQWCFGCEGHSPGREDRELSLCQQWGRVWEGGQVPEKKSDLPGQ